MRKPPRSKLSLRRKSLHGFLSEKKSLSAEDMTALARLATTVMSPVPPKSWGGDGLSVTKYFVDHALQRLKEEIPQAHKAQYQSYKWALACALSDAKGSLRKQTAVTLLTDLDPKQIWRREGGSVGAWFAPVRRRSLWNSRWTVHPLQPLAQMLSHLEQTKEPKRAAQFFTEFMRYHGETEGLADLPLLLAIERGQRAAETYNLADRVSDSQWTVELRQSASAILERAITDLAKPVQVQDAVLLAIGGLSGTGKSSLAARIAPRIGGQKDAFPAAIILSSDVIRKQLFGAKILTEKLPEEAYAPEMTARVAEETRRRMDAALKAGCSVILDQTYRSRQSRLDTEEAMGRHTGVSECFWLYAPEDILRQRVEDRTDRLSISDADLAILERQLQIGDIQPKGWRILNSNMLSENLDAEVMRDIEVRRVQKRLDQGSSPKP